MGKLGARLVADGRHLAQLGAESLDLLAGIGLDDFGVGQRLAAHLARRGFGRFPPPRRLFERFLLALEQAFRAPAAFLVASLRVRLACQLRAPGRQLLGRQPAKLRAQRHVVGGPLRPVALRGFGDVRDAPAQVGDAGGDLLAVA